MSLFSGENLTCIRGGRIVFDGLDFDLAPGGALILRGPNGSGKSSLLRVMAGFIPPAGGALRWAERMVRDDPASHAGRIGYIGHRDAVKAPFTARENLESWAAITGRRQARPTDDVLSALGIAALAETPARYLSAGQRQRLALGRLLVTETPLWLLDEPANALDTDGTLALEQCIAAHRAAGGMVAVSLHGALDIPDGRALDLDAFQPSDAAHNPWAGV